MAKPFPLTPDLPNIELRNREKFQVNKAKTEKYFKNTIPYCQRILNQASQGTKKPASTSEENWKLWMAGLQERLRSRREHRTREEEEEEGEDREEEGDDREVEGEDREEVGEVREEVGGTRQEGCEDREGEGVAVDGGPGEM